MNDTTPNSKALTAPGAAGPAATPGRASESLPARRSAGQLVGQLRTEWLPRAAWSISRTGRLGLAGIALLVASGLFLVSTHLEIAGEVESLRDNLATSRRARPGTAEKAPGPATARPALPARTEMPAILRQLFNRAAQAGLALDAGRYEVSAGGSGGIVRYQIALPVTGSYPKIRSFIDSALATIPAIALNELAFDRKSIGEAEVQAQIRMTVYTAGNGAAGATTPAPGQQEPPRVAEAALASAPESPPATPGASKAGPASDRVVGPTHASALFAPHSWYVAPPPPPPVPAPPPPAPTAPPFPYTYVGSYAPEGHTPVYFLSRGDRVIDAHVGERLDGVYQFESANGSELVFTYLPLNVRQALPAGISQ
jgi:hypothetical protein